MICSASVVRAVLVWRSWSSPERGLLQIPERGLEIPDPGEAGLSHSPCSASSEPSSCSSPCSSSKCGHQDCWFWDAAFWVAAASFPTGRPARDRFRPTLIPFFDQTGKLAWSWLGPLLTRGLGTLSLLALTLCWVGHLPAHSVCPLLACLELHRQYIAPCWV